jgi:pyruvate-ferredoxin/flavodoxin oxidoreductase
MNEKGKRFMLDSKDPSIPMEDFMYNENRFATIKNNNPERAHEFLDQANQGMHTRLEKLLAFKNL